MRTSGISAGVAKAGSDYASAGLFLHGSTIAINTILERTGARTALVITEGFRDVYESDLTYQWIDISNVQPGRYALAGRVDPRNVILERDEGNNGYAFRDEPVVVAGHLAQPVSARQTGGPVTVTLQAQTFGSPGARRLK